MCLKPMMTMVTELVLTRNQLMQMLRATSDSEFKTPLQRLSGITAELQDCVMKTQHAVHGSAWKKLPRIVRDAGQDLAKKIDLVMEGEATELDRQVLELIKDPLTHDPQLRDHGVEAPPPAPSAGKPETGTIKLHAVSRRRPHHHRGQRRAPASTPTHPRHGAGKNVIDAAEAMSMTDA